VTTFAIDPAYVARWPVRQHDPFDSDEAYQDAVYARAKALLTAVDGSLLVDWGCGSAVKLRKYFAPAEVVGVDLPHIVQRHARRSTGYTFADPGAAWLDDVVPDVVLSADVIEHVENPVPFLADLRALGGEWLVLSTPAREHIAGGSLTGPPRNRCHAREWTMAEFAEFLTGAGVEIHEHTLIDPERATQCVVGRFSP